MVRDIQPAILQDGEYGGKLVALPLSLTPHGFWFNKALMKKAGLNPSQPPQTITALDHDMAVIKAKLPKVDIERPRSLIGKSTEASIQSGIVYGFAGQVDGICERLRDELGRDIKINATGGFASVIVGFTKSIDEVDDLLTLKGLRLIYERNAQA